MTKRELAAEVERLRAENAALRAHVCLPASPVCSCATGQLATLPCPVHQPGGMGGGLRIWNNCGAGAAGLTTTIKLDIAEGSTWHMPNLTTIGAAAPPLTQTFR
jgi:hypothetical protein